MIAIPPAIAEQPTLRLYSRGATELLQALGEDVSQWTAQGVRAFLLERARQCGAGCGQGCRECFRYGVRIGVNAYQRQQTHSSAARSVSYDRAI